MTFAHRELNLHKVFWEVQSRGGYQAVCATKQWKVRYLLCFAQCCVKAAMSPCQASVEQMGLELAYRRAVTPHMESFLIALRLL